MPCHTAGFPGLHPSVQSYCLSLYSLNWSFINSFQHSKSFEDHILPYNSLPIGQLSTLLHLVMSHSWFSKAPLLCLPQYSCEDTHFELSETTTVSPIEINAKIKATLIFLWYLWEYTYFKLKYQSEELLQVPSCNVIWESFFFATCTCI